MNLQSKGYPTRSQKEKLIDNDIQEIENELIELAALIPSGGLVQEKYSPVTLTGGDLIIGEEYTITTYLGGIVSDVYKDTNGTGYTTATAAATTGGTGTGLTVDTVASGGRITSVVINDGGTGYTVGDQIAISGGGAGVCYITVTAVLSDDFTNVGAAVNQTGEVFIATGTTPADYSNGSTLDSTGSIVTLNEVNPTPWLNKMYVNISSAQILAMGTTPITLLAAPGAGMYYDIEKIILEYTHVTTAYSFAGIITLFEQYSTAIDSAIITGAGNRFSITKENSYPSDAVGYNYAVAKALNQSLTLTTDDSSNPTLGDGTLRAIITYTVRTFGA